MPFISIITPIYNSPKTIKAYLDAIFNSTYKDFELVLIDDGSPEDLQEFLKGYPPVIFKKLEHRHGAYYARHQAVEMSHGQVLLFLDADVIVKPETLGKIAAVLEDHPEASGMIGSYDDSPQAGNTVTQFKFLYHHYIHQHEGEYVGSFWTGCGAVRKDVFKKLDGFNLSFFHELNAVMDIEFGYRLKLNHYKIYNARHIQVKHLKKLTFVNWVSTDFLTRGLPWVKIMLSYRQFYPTLNINVIGCINVICVWLMLAAGLAGFFDKVLWAVEGLLLGIFLITHYGLLSFFSAKRGFLFMLKAIPLLWIYYFNCGLCVLWGLILNKRI